MHILTAQELIAVTGYSRPSYQAKALTNMGIPFKRKPDDTILLTAEAVEESLRAKTAAAGSVGAQDEGFNWSKE